MFKSTLVVVAVFLFALTPVIAATPVAPSRNEVIAQVTKAVEFYRANGREKAIAELNRRDGAFAKGMDYVDVHDLNGVCVARRKCEKPPVVTTSRKRFSPAWAPSASPTSCESEAGVQSSVDAP